MPDLRSSTVRPITSMINRRPVLLAAGLFLALVTSAQTKSPFTYRDMLMLDRISGLAVDPAGTTALFTVRATDMEKTYGAVAVRSGFVLYDFGR